MHESAITSDCPSDGNGTSAAARQLQPALLPTLGKQVRRTRRTANGRRASRLPEGIPGAHSHGIDADAHVPGI